MQNYQAISRFLVLAGLFSLLPGYLACGTTKSSHGHSGGDDQVASGFEERLEALSEGIADQDLTRAQDAQADLDKYLEQHRRELELHPEGSMMFSRYDLVKRRMRQFQADWAEQEAARKKLEAENKIREPVDKASGMAAALEGKSPPSMDQVEALKQAIAVAQEALNDARRQKSLALDDPLTKELQQRLDALDKSFLQLRAKARAVEIRDLFIKGQEAFALTEGPGDPEEKKQAYQEASSAFQDCQRQGEQLLQRNPDLARYRVDIKGKRKSKKLKALVALCAQRRDKIVNLQKKLQQAQEKAERLAAQREAEQEQARREAQAQAEQMQELLDGKSPAQQRVLKKWGRAPDVTKQRRGKEVWIYVKKKGRRRHRREYTFNQAGRLIKERRR